MHVRQPGKIEYFGPVPGGLTTVCTNPSCGAHLETEVREPGAYQRTCIVGGEEMVGWVAKCIICGHEVFFLVPLDKLLRDAVPVQSAAL